MSSPREFPDRPLVGVGAIVFDPAGRVLLVRRGNEPRKGHWSIPGGLVELGETLLNAVGREIFEETGLNVTPLAVVEIVDRIYKVSGEAADLVKYHYVVIDYLCKVTGGCAKPASDALEIAWASRAEWTDTNDYSLETITLQVIEKGWQMARGAGAHGQI